MVTYILSVWLWFQLVRDHIWLTSKHWTFLLVSFAVICLLFSLLLVNILSTARDMKRYCSTSVHMVLMVMWLIFLYEIISWRKQSVTSKKRLFCFIRPFYSSRWLFLLNFVSDTAWGVIFLVILKWKSLLSGLYQTNKVQRAIFDCPPQFGLRKWILEIFEMCQWDSGQFLKGRTMLFCQASITVPRIYRIIWSYNT